MNRRHKTIKTQIKKGKLKLPKKSLPKTIDPEALMNDNIRTSNSDNNDISTEKNISDKDTLTMMVTLKGSRWAYIENYSYIADYTDKMIKIMGKEQMLVLEGMRLSLIYFTEDDLLLGGRILSIRYL
jgi:sporulation protein YqfC